MALMQFYNRIRNLAPLIISLSLGTAFWFYAKTDSVITTYMKFPIKVETSRNLIVTTISPDSLTLRVTGKLRLQQILQNTVPRIKASYNHTGMFTIALEENSLRFPVWLRVKEFDIIEPDSIKIHLDSLIQKKIPVILIEGLHSSPGEVTIKGPRSIIENISYISPDSIPKGNITTITIVDKLIEVKPHRIRIKR